MKLRKLDRETSVAAVFLTVAFLFYLFVVGWLLPGCPIRVDPPTEDVCGGHTNCGICASEAVCVWCGGTETCLGRSSTTCDVETVVSIPERCPGAIPGE